MAKKKEDKKLTKDQAEKKIQALKKDLFNILHLVQILMYCLYSIIYLKNY